MSHDDFQREPVRGLPAALPPGEHILWQGAPDWKALAWRAFGLRLVLAWFGAMALWTLWDGVAQGMGPVTALVGLVPQAVMAALAAAIIGVIAWSTARTTVYTLTNRRAALRINLAMTVTLNVPFSRIASAALKDSGRTGDVTLRLAGSDRFAWFLLWPHCRPFALRNPEPAFRAIPDAQRAAAILGQAVAEHAAEHGRTVVPGRAPAPAGGPLAVAAE